MTFKHIAMKQYQQLRARLCALFSLNDSRWGRGAKGNNSTNDSPKPYSQQRPQDGPPDLDELWQEFNNKLNRLLGKRLKGGNGYKPPSGKKGTSVGLGFICFILFAIWMATGIYIVQEGQVGVVLQFGKFKYTTRPGINWRLPWPIQEQEIVNLSALRSVEIGRLTLIKSANLKDSSMLTEDENIIDVKFAVQYRLKDAADYLFNNRDVDSTVIQAAEAAVREIVGRNKMDFVLYEGREKIAIDLAQLIQKLLDNYRAGVFVTSVTIQNVQPPEQVQAAFDDAVKAGQDRERLKNEGQAYANDILPKAVGTAARLLEEAKGYKARLELQAEGDAARFRQLQAEYSKAPAVTRERLYLETMQQILSATTKVLVESKQGSQLLYLPLDKLINYSDTQPTTANPNSAVVIPQANNPSQSSIDAPGQIDLRTTREGLRNRELH